MVDSIRLVSSRELASDHKGVSCQWVHNGLREFRQRFDLVQYLDCGLHNLLSWLGDAELVEKGYFLLGVYVHADSEEIQRLVNKLAGEVVSSLNLNLLDLLGLAVEVALD